jgi:hypothetical protein
MKRSMKWQKGWCNKTPRFRNIPPPKRVVLWITLGAVLCCYELFPSLLFRALSLDFIACARSKKKKKLKQSLHQNVEAKSVFVSPKILCVDRQGSRSPETAITFVGVDCGLILVWYSGTRRWMDGVAQTTSWTSVLKPPWPSSHLEMVEMAMVPATR